MDLTILERATAGAALASALQLVLWARQRITRDATIVDVGWSASLGVLAVLHALIADGDPARRAAVAALAGIASARLTAHLVRDRVRKGVEDPRYRALRERWGTRAPSRFFVLFLAQGLLAGALAGVFALAASSREPLGALDAIALAAGVIALGGEALADRQLARFRADPANRGRTCRVGLWRASRHPNYFFQWCLWCSYAALAWSAPYGWLGFLAPLAMGVLIVRVTGIPPSEEQALRSRGADYRDYQRTTSAFFPWFPKAATTR